MLIVAVQVKTPPCHYCGAQFRLIIIHGFLQAFFCCLCKCTYAHAHGVIAFESLHEVRPLYGQRMMKRVLESTGVKVAEYCLAEALEQVAPAQYQSRQGDTTDRLNPVPYTSTHFGHKLHMDQNE